MAKKNNSDAPAPESNPETTVSVQATPTITSVEGATATETATTGIPAEVAGVTVIMADPNVAPAETPAPSPSPEDPIKTVVDSAPVEENGYVQPTSAAELSYAKELAARIAKSKESGFNKVKVAHADFVKMNAEGLIDFETRVLIQSGQQLVINDAPDCATGTYWNVTE
jgi:hypothetical protein